MASSVASCTIREMPMAVNLDASSSAPRCWEEGLLLAFIVDNDQADQALVSGLAWVEAHNNGTRLGLIGLIAVLRSAWFKSLMEG
jgi:hypothetical protein